MTRRLWRVSFPVRVRLKVLAIFLAGHGGIFLLNWFFFTPMFWNYVAPATILAFFAGVISFLLMRVFARRV